MPFPQELSVVVGAKTASFQKKFDAMRARLNTFANSMAKLGVTAGVGLFAKLGFDALKMGSSLDAASKKIGVTTDLLQVLGFAFEQNDSNVNAATTSVQRFARRLGEAANGEGVLLKALERSNIKIFDQRGRLRDTDEVLGDYADAMANARTHNEAMALATAAFDQEGVLMINVLGEGRKGLKAWSDQAKASGAVMERDVIASLAKADAAIVAFKRRATIEVGNILVDFQTETGRDKLMAMIMNVLAGWAGSLVDLWTTTAKLAFNLLSTAFKNNVAVFQNLMVDAIQIIANNANKILPKRWEIDVDSLDNIKMEVMTISEVFEKAIQKTEPSNFKKFFQDFWVERVDENKKAQEQEAKAAEDLIAKQKAADEARRKAAADRLAAEKAMTEEAAEQARLAKEAAEQAEREAAAAEKKFRSAQAELRSRLGQVNNALGTEDIRRLSDLDIQGLISKAQTDIQFLNQKNPDLIRNIRTAGGDFVGRGALGTGIRFRLIDQLKRELSLRGEFRRRFGGLDVDTAQSQFNQDIARGQGLAGPLEFEGLFRAAVEQRQQEELERQTELLEDIDERVKGKFKLF